MNRELCSELSIPFLSINYVTGSPEIDTEMLLKTLIISTYFRPCIRHPEKVLSKALFLPAVLKCLHITKRGIVLGCDYIQNVMHRDPNYSTVFNGGI